MCFLLLYRYEEDGELEVTKKDKRPKGFQVQTSGTQGMSRELNIMPVQRFSDNDCKYPKKEKREML